MITEDILSKYKATIGIECHVQLSTQTKLFSGADNDARDAEPNIKTSPIDFGLPGMLPVLNKNAIRLAILAAKALNAPVAKVSRFDRKHYFYPDLPKGYQISQMYEPLIQAGYVDAPLKDGSVIHIRINHAHVEEDAGKLTHFSSYSLIDLNRAGTPLIEIVSEPDMHSPEEARAYATELYRLMVYSNVTLGDLYHGNMRFDVNVSVAPVQSDKLGQRTEIKNLNSFRSVEKAADYEIKRQIDIITRGGNIDQETRGWDEAKQKTTSQRSKENAQDYRYMPDADIPPIVLTDEIIDDIQKDLPNLPQYYRNKWADLNMDGSVIEKLLSNQSYAVLVSNIQDKANNDAAKRVAYWLSSAVEQNDEESTSIAINFSPDNYIELSEMVANNELSSTAAKEIFNELMTSDKSPRAIATEKNILQISDESAIESVVDSVLNSPASSQSIEDIKNGKDKAIGYLVGQVMKQSKGKANPSVVQKIIRNKISM
jgi:aspartyl-tRNA(Asn)/glutamyl-tRNA(Gln) amidotransferase subunit B